jgi:O-succinylbenzoic acid--CoA ligase
LTRAKTTDEASAKTSAKTSAISLGWLDRVARHRGEEEALLVQGTSIDYTTLVARSRSSAARLRSLGVEAGDLVAVLAPPSSAGVALLHGVLDGGFVMLPLNQRLSESEQADALIRTHARFLVVARDVDRASAERLCDSAGCGLLEFDSTDIPLEREIEWTCLRPLPDSKSAVFAEHRARRHAEHAALVLQTSGTSGRPKAAILSLANLIASAEASAEMLGSKERDRWLLCMPLFHIGGLSILIRSALLGTSVVLHERFDADRVACALDEDRVTQVSFVATMLAKVIDARGARRAPASLSLVLLGGGPASQALLLRAHRLGYPLAPTYGLTEAASQVATRPPSETISDEDDLAAGLAPLPGVEIRVVGADGNPVEAGTEGEIEVRGSVLMCGYLDDPGATSESIREGWFATGDVGRLDSVGRLRVLDRREDLIVSGGENVYPAEIESVLGTSPEVADAGVIGVSDEAYGARPLAFVVLRQGASLDRVALDAYCRTRLASFKIPVDFIELAELPRTASGKLIRRKLAREL